MSDIPKGYCQCGCGEKTKLASKNRPERGDIKGQPIRYIFGHQWSRNVRGKKPNSRTTIVLPDGSFVLEHILIMEKALGREILPGEVVHHIDGNPGNNHIGNLMLFKTQAMHAGFHHRLRSFAACGNYEWRKCCFCHQWDDPKNMVKREPRSMCHFVCSANYDKKRIRVR